SSGVAEVTGEEELRPEKAAVMGPIKVMRQEHPQVYCRHIDVIIPPPGSWQEERLTSQLIDEFSAESADQVTAYRGNHRWVQTYEAARTAPSPVGAGLRPAGVYLITGGLGRVGMIIAEYLARAVKARLALTGRKGLPERSEWDRLLGQAEFDDEIKRKIIKVREMEDAGAEVEVIRAEVSDEVEMMEEARRANQRFSAINEGIHLSYMPD